MKHFCFDLFSIFYLDWRGWVNFDNQKVAHYGIAIQLSTEFILGNKKPDVLF